MNQTGHQINIERVKNGYIICLGKPDSSLFSKGDQTLYDPTVCKTHDEVLEALKERLAHIDEMTFPVKEE